MSEINRRGDPTARGLKETIPEEGIAGRHLEQILSECGNDAETAEKVLATMLQKLQAKGQPSAEISESKPLPSEINAEVLAKFEKLVLSSIDEIDYNLSVKTRRRFNSGDIKGAFQELFDSRGIPVKIEEVIIPENRERVEFKLEGVDRYFAVVVGNTILASGRSSFLFDAPSYSRQVKKTTRLAQFRPETPGHDFEVFIKGSVDTR